MLVKLSLHLRPVPFYTQDQAPWAKPSAPPCSYSTRHRGAGLRAATARCKMSVVKWEKLPAAPWKDSQGRCVNSTSTAQKVGHSETRKEDSQVIRSTEIAVLLLLPFYSWLTTFRYRQIKLFLFVKLYLFSFFKLLAHQRGKKNMTFLCIIIWTDDRQA